MDTESLIKLVAIGRARDLEETWLGLLEKEPTSEQWCQRARVLKALVDSGRAAEAETLATTTVELLAGHLAELQLLETSKAFLLVLKDSGSLRETVGEMYRRIHADVPGLDALLEEAGVEGGRPPRRAIRTIDLCLQLEVGSHIAHRHEDVAARVEHIDRDTWQVDYAVGDSRESLGAVELADNFELADLDDFRVMAQFDHSRLTTALRDDPGAVVTSIVRSNGYLMDSDALRAVLSPRFIEADKWTKWWTKARQALRLLPHMKVEGRSPYFLTFDPSGTTLEQEAKAKLEKAHDPLKELAVIDEYLRGCKARKQAPDDDLLARARDRIEQRARRAIARSGKVDLTPWLAARRIGELMGDAEAGAHVADALRRTDDPAAAILAVEVGAFWPAACDALEEARPDNLAEALQRLLPHAPLRVADHIAERLIDLQWPSERFQEMADKIVRDPVMYNEGLLWLWDGSFVEAAHTAIPRIAMVTKILHAVGELKRRDDISRDRSKQILANTRDVLRARNFERFRQMLDQIDSGVAAALRTQIERLHNLGRVGEDLLKLIHRTFPDLRKVKPKMPKWLQDEVLFVTAAGYRRKRAAVEELVNVKMRENAVAIGNAAEHGDLSENSEYKFALEERDLLQARLGQMQREMEQARILRAPEVPTDHVSIGCGAVLERIADGVRQELVILGPWEADPDRKIYNYKTPLAQSILGTPLGETATVDFFDPPGEYRVVEIINALDADSYYTDTA